MFKKTQDYVLRDRLNCKVKGGDVVEYHPSDIVDPVPQKYAGQFTRKGLITWTGTISKDARTILKDKTPWSGEFVLKVADSVIRITPALSMSIIYLKKETEQRRGHNRQRIIIRRNIRNRR